METQEPQPAKKKMGRPRKSIEEKIRNGTLRPARERRYQGMAIVPDLGKAPKPHVAPRSYAAIFETYLSGVESGAVVGGDLLRAAVRRQRADCECGDGLAYVWDQAYADAACHFIEQLPLVDDEDWGSPYIILEPFQVFVVSLLYGWRLRANPKRRRFTTLYLEVGRKSAKSTLMAALAYYHLLKESTAGASVICGATTGQQARMVFGIMQKQGRLSGWLQKHGVQVLSNSIVCPNGDARPVNSKASSLDGLNPSMIILDESHAQDFGLHDVLKSAQGSRGNALLVCPTTAGENLLSVGYALHQQAERMLEGLFEADHLLGVIYTLDVDDDWRDERVWGKANPMLGRSPKLDYMRNYCTDAQQVPATAAEFRIKACNQWGHAATRWLSPESVARCVDRSLRIEDFVGRPCWIGGDLALRDDLAAIAAVFERDDELVAFVQCYLPDGVIAERSRMVPHYGVWRDTGILEATDGTMIDYARIEAKLRDWCRIFDVRAVVFDEWGSAQICGNLFNSGLPASILPKRAKEYTPPSLDFQARVTHGKFKFDGNPIVEWAIGNARVTPKIDGSVLPKKESADSPNKIDPLDAILQAMAARLSAQKPPPRHQLLILGGARRT